MLRGLFTFPCLFMMLVCVGCGGARYAYVIDEQGNWLQQTPALMKERDEQRLSRNLQEAFPELDGAKVSIQTEPFSRRSDNGIAADNDGVLEWVYPGVVAEVVLYSAEKEAALLQGAEELVTNYLSKRLAVGNEGIQLTMSQGSTPPRPAGQEYLIQKGDTLATIAAVFYGSAQHWRRITDANPGLDANALQPGTSIWIPDAVQP